jgi:hypothetical protein
MVPFIPSVPLVPLVPLVPSAKRTTPGPCFYALNTYSSALAGKRLKRQQAVLSLVVRERVYEN